MKLPEFLTQDISKLNQPVPSTAPTAQQANKSAQSIASGIIGLLVMVGLVWYFFLGGLTQQTTANLQNVYDKVAADQVAQYQIVKRNGTAMDACVHAGLVAAGYVQAKNEAAYAQWKQIEKQDCAAAGVPK